jgi:hypothetical protein
MKLEDPLYGKLISVGGLVGVSKTRMSLFNNFKFFRCNCEYI